MATKLFTFVGQPKVTQAVIHYEGIPPSLIGTENNRKKLPWPKVLIIEEDSEGFFLLRFSADKSDAGDTCHESLEDAKNQAEFEYGDALGAWQEIPETVSDSLGYSFSRIEKIKVSE